MFILIISFNFIKLYFPKLYYFVRLIRWHPVARPLEMFHCRCCTSTILTKFEGTMPIERIVMLEGVMWRCKAGDVNVLLLSNDINRCHHVCHVSVTKPRPNVYRSLDFFLWSFNPAAANYPPPSSAPTNPWHLLFLTIIQLQPAAAGIIGFYSTERWRLFLVLYFVKT